MPKRDLHQELLDRIKLNLPEIKKFLSDLDADTGTYELLYRFCSGSYKAQWVRGYVQSATKLIYALADEHRGLNSGFVALLDAGTRSPSETPLLKSPRHEIYGWANDVFTCMIDAPVMYGLPSSVELQALLILELKAFIVNPDLERKNPHHVTDAWLEFIRDDSPNTNTMLADRLETEHPGDREKHYEALTKALMDFRDQSMFEIEPEKDPQNLKPCIDALLQCHSLFRAMVKAAEEMETVPGMIPFYWAFVTTVFRVR